MSFPASKLKRLIWWVMIDAVILFAAYTIAFSARTVEIPFTATDSLIFSLFALLVMITLQYAFGIYRRIWSKSSGNQISLLVQSVTVATLIIAATNLMIEPRPLPMSVILIGNLIALGGFSTARYRSRLISGASWRWRAIWHLEFPDEADKPVRALIVGAGESGQALAWRLQYRLPESNYKLVGFVDDDADKQDMFIEGLRVLGTRENIPALAEEHNVDLIAVAMHRINGADFRELLSYCERTKARIKVIPDVLAMMNTVSGAPMLRDVEPEDLIGRTRISHHEGVDFSPVRNKVVLVTGAAGSIGAELSRQMTGYAPKKIILLDINESALHDLVIDLQSKYPKLDIQPVLADITIEPWLRHIFQEHPIELIFHAAAYKHVPLLQHYPQESIRVNIGGTLNVARLACEFQVERFVLISTDKAVNPSSVMGASKRIGELILHALSESPEVKTVFTAVRFGNVLGSRGSVVPTFERQIANGGPVTVTHPDMTRFFMSIPEAVNLVIHAACLTEGDDIFVLRMGDEVRIVDIAERMIRLRGLRPYRDIKIDFVGVRPGEKLYEELYSGAEKPHETIHDGIFKLEGWNNSFNRSAFWQKIEVLVHEGIGKDEDPLLCLKSVAMPN